VSARANQLLEAGLWLKMSGDLDGARRLFEQALRLDPDSIRARELLGHSLPESEAVPEELRDVPVTRTDLFSVPLPRLFQDEPAAPTSMPEEWWNAPPSGNTARFFVQGAQGSAAGEQPSPSFTLPWGPSPLPPRDAPAAPKGGPALSPAPAPPPARAAATAPAGAAGTPPGPVPLPASAGAAEARRTPTPAPAPVRGPPPATPSRNSGPIPLPSGLAPPVASGPMAPSPSAGGRGPPGGEPPRTGAVPLPSTGAAGAGTVPAVAAASAAREAAPPPGAPQRTTGPVPLPPAAVPGGPTPPPPWLGPSQQPLPWPMPASGPVTTPSKGVGAVPLTPAGAGSVLSPPRGPAAASAPPTIPAAKAPPRVQPSDAWGAEGEGPTLLAPEGPEDALELLAEPRGVTGLTPLPAPRDPRSEAVRLFERARELQNLDDHSGARELLLQAQGLNPELTGLSDALSRSEAKLQTIYESKIGKLGAVPRVRLKDDEVIWLNLDHRAGFMLAQIDGTLTFEDLFSVSGMTRLDTARILAQLLDQRVIVS